MLPALTRRGASRLVLPALQAVPIRSMAAASKKERKAKTDKPTKAKAKAESGGADSKKNTQDGALLPEETVSLLDKHIVGQNEAKRAVAIALRDQWRRQQLVEDLQREVLSK